MSQKLQPARPGEMTASAAVNFFDNICDDAGNKLTKSAKRTRLKEKMMQLYYTHPEDNFCILSDEKKVAIIVCRQGEGRAAFCYFNNVDAPQDAVLRAFAEKEGITYKQQQAEYKHTGELIANDAKQYFDDVCDASGNKLTGFAKLERLHQLFAAIYQDKESNTCITPDGIIPLIVVRKGENSRDAYCLNTSLYRAEVMQAFADKTNCTYRQDKENKTIQLPKQKGELTARDCARIFHNVPNLDGSDSKRYTSPKLVEWFTYIGTDDRLNQITLPSGEIVPIVVYRQSHAQQCWCLNTSDERIKPFVIKRVSQITKADICLENITFAPDKPKELYQTIISLAKEASKSENTKSNLYYSEYAKKIYHDMRFGKETNLTDWIIKQKNKKK